MIAAVYCRVSTDSQERDGTSLDSQQQACLKKAQELKYEVPEALIFRETYSGLSTDRPLLSVLRQKAKTGEFGAVIVFSPDRLSRVGEEILTLFKELSISGVKLICVNNQVEDTLTGKMIAFILGWSSELEAAQIKERTMRGKTTLASRGILPQGTGKGLFGYKWVKATKKRVIDEYEARIVSKIFNMVADGDTLYKVATTLNETGITTRAKGKWNPLTVRRLVTNSGYIGKTYFGKTQWAKKVVTLMPEDKWHLLPDTTPPIITEELFNRANKALKQSSQLHHGRPLHDYLLTGHVKCGYCGNPLVGSCLSHKYRYYHCKGAYPTSIRKAFCKAKYIRAELVETVVWDKVKEILEHPEVMLADLKRRTTDQSSNKTPKISKEITAITKRIGKYPAEEERLIKLYRHGGIDEESVTKEIDQLKKERQADQDSLAELSKLKDQEVELAKAAGHITESCDRIKQNLKTCSSKDMRYALDALDITVVVTDEKVEIKASVPLEFTAVEKKSHFMLTGNKRHHKLQPILAPNAP